VRWENALLAYADDIRARTWLDWLTAHTSFMKPLHRYRGSLELRDSALRFHGEDRKQRRPFQLVVPLSAIRGLRLGFDEVFRRSEDRQLGLFGFEPLKITYEDGDGPRTLYVFAHFHHRLGVRASDNRELYREPSAPTVSPLCTDCGAMRAYDGREAWTQSKNRPGGPRKQRRGGEIQGSESLPKRKP
jgi:hypothetical protein